MSSRVIRQGPDHVYYNVLIPHNDTISVNSAPTKAVFKETRSDPIIQNPSEYYMSVVRFFVPASVIPIFIFTPNAYSVTLSFDGVDEQVFVPYISSSDFTVGTTDYYSVYSYQNFIDMINSALSTAFTTLKTAKPLAPPTEAPYMIYNSTTKLMSIVAQKSYDPVTAGGPTIEIFFNIPLYNFFSSFNTYYFMEPTTLGKQNQILIYDTKNNAFDATHFIMTQEYETLFAWNAFKSIVLTSGSIPSRSEYVTNSTTASGSSNANTNDNFRPIISDFLFSASEGPEFKSGIEYLPTAEYRIIDLQGSKPLTDIDIQVYWQDNYQNLFPIFIPAHDAVTIKILFRKKSLGSK
jgi:hypothetical protein